VKNAEDRDRALGWLLDAEWETSAPLESVDHAEALALLTELLKDAVAQDAVPQSAEAPLLPA
jgi:hypothetical protein